MRALAPIFLSVFPLALAGLQAPPTTQVTGDNRLGTRQAANPAANASNVTKADFLVDGSKIPLLKETVQDSYAGLLPLTNEPGENKKIFFWYWPSSAAEGSQSLAIWLNGGPGCSSLVGFLNENGAFTVSPTKGDLRVSRNKYAWGTVSDMLYIDQPIGVGFSSPSLPTNVKNQDDVAQGLYQFLQQFYSVFPDLIKKKLYITGESYAGFYIPYIARRIVNASGEEKSALPIDLQGILINDGLYSGFLVNQYAPLADFAAANQETLGLNDTVIASARAAAKECGFDELMAGLTYPPRGPLRLDNNTDRADCVEVLDGLFGLPAESNPCFYIYNINQKCPGVEDRTPDYFSLPEVKKLLHVEEVDKWVECSSKVLRDEKGRNADPSPFSETLIPGLIEALPRGVTLWHGLLDMILVANGTRITIQSMTWGGKQGFQTKLTQPIVLGGQTRGVQHSERGLTYYELTNAGHMAPADEPELGLEIFKTVIGQGNLVHTDGPKGSDNSSTPGGDGVGAGFTKTAGFRHLLGAVIFALVL